MEPPSVFIFPDVAGTLSEQLPELLQFLQAHSGELALTSPPVTASHPRVLIETGLAIPGPFPQKRKRALVALTLMDQALSPTSPFLTLDSRPSKKARAQLEPALFDSEDNEELFIPLALISLALLLLEQNIISLMQVRPLLFRVPVQNLRSQSIELQLPVPPEIFSILLMLQNNEAAPIPLTSLLTYLLASHGLIWTSLTKT
ncbi:hypothetical protein C8J56DRAFT_1061350 [Mycena floridula]|nr:hypothetical protein C8J56DRAFT_1061350 [Mycena floridula]